jgi:hypothetical protein
MIRASTLLWMFAVIAVGYAMFQVKYEVMQQEETLARINKQIVDDRETIRVLDAEWSFLTQPARLAKLNRLLDLQPLTAVQISRLDAIPDRPGAGMPLVSPIEPAPMRLSEGSEVVTVNASAGR